MTATRTAATLSGGESQRIRLATQIGSRLTGVLYIPYISELLREGNFNEIKDIMEIVAELI